MRVLILGGTGTISTGITRQLLDRGDEVILFTRGRTPHDFGRAVREVHGDRGSRADLTAALDAAGPFDALVDMIGFTAEDATELAAAIDGRVPLLLFCSTVDVYTKPAPVLPVTEASPLHPSPAFPYAFAKREAELVLETAAAAGAFGLVLLRPAATYLGQAVAPVGTWPVMVDRLRRGLPIILHGDGTGLWASCHRDDVAAAFVAALDAPRAVGRAYTLAGSELLDWNAYWATVAAALGVEPRVLHVPTDVLVRLAPRLAEWTGMNFRHAAVYDSSEAARDLGFRSRRSWADGVAGFDLDAVPPPDDRDAAEYDDLVRRWLELTAAIDRDPARLDPARMETPA